MRKTFFLFMALCFLLSACVPNMFQTQPTSPAPVIPDIQATVAAQVEQTLQSMPTPTFAPSTTPIVITATSAPTNTMLPPTFTATQVPATLTATSLQGTATSTVETALATASMVPAVNATPTGTSHYQYYGTMPPDLPSGKIAMINKSKRDAYISLQCTTTDGYVTIIEYPVGGSWVGTRAPAGNYVYVAWVGGKQFTGRFKLEKSGEASIWMYKDRVEVK